jgi:hypothetical protein
MKLGRTSGRFAYLQHLNDAYRLLSYICRRNAWKRSHVLLYLLSPNWGRMPATSGAAGLYSMGWGNCDWRGRERKVNSANSGNAKR